ncbi:substrate-binding domain-containing protein [Intrasporangium oryzae]|uniref:substrate-binding domain-containing protein n=1 Tax=Intrasporangium oryzae TaxID=412687 RepID=UPI0004AD5CBC|nr:substrate-binding domain-containing protein [Intrasporangium oryzae]
MIGALVGTLAVASVGVGAWTLVGNRSGGAGGSSAAAGGPRSCANPATVRLAVASSVFPALSAVTDALNNRSDGPCATFDLDAVDGYAVAGAVSGPGSPDAWVTDSAEWVSRATTTAGRTITAGPVFATSGVVVALPRSAGESAGARPTWSSTLGGSVPVQVSDPRRSAEAALGLAAASAGGLADKDVSAIAAKGGSVPDTGIDLDKVASGSPATGALVTEAEVSAFNAANPDRALATVAPTDATAAVEYTLVPLTRDAKTASLVKALGDYLQTDDARTILAKQGFRTPGGPTPSLPEPIYGSATIGSAPPAAAVSKVRQLWSASAPRTQALLALDVSGSVLERAADGTRLEIIQRATSQAVAAAAPDTNLALWLYSLHLGTKGDDYKQVLGYGSLGDGGHIAGIDKALAGLTKSVGGGSGLYDTIAAAYDQAAGSWATGRTNRVVVLTDGPNEDDYGLTLPLLEQRLATAKQSGRPVQVVIIGVGSKADAKTMTAIAKLTGGSYIAAPQPGDLLPALTSALGG